MASRQVRRIRERLDGKDKQGKKAPMKISALTIPSIVVILLVLVGLLWWGSSTQQSSGGTIVFGSYDGRPITWTSGNYFARKVFELMETPSFSGEKMDSEKAVRDLLPYMIFHTAALIEAEKNGLTVSDSEVEEFIKARDQMTRYNKADAVERHDLFQVFKEELIELKLLQVLIQSYDNKALEDNAAAMGKTEKKFKYVQWKYDDYPMQEIAKFAAENKDLFRSIKLSRIAAKTESEAKDAYTKITSRQSTFDDQAKAISKVNDPNASGLEWQSYYNLEKSIGSKDATEKVFALKQGEISDVIAFGSEWFIYRCDKESVPADLSAEKTIKEIKSYILQFQKGRVETYFEGESKGFLEKAKKDGLTAAAAATKLKVYETGFFPLNYNSLSFLKQIPDMKDPSTSIGNAQSESVFFKDAFALKKNEISKPILLQDLVIICEMSDERTVAPSDMDKINSDFKNLKNRDVLNFFYYISYRLYVRGMPIIYTGQNLLSPDPVEFAQYAQMGILRSMQNVMFDTSKVALNAPGNPAVEFFNRFVDLDKMGPRADREEAMATGLEDYRKMFTPKQ
jgi:hypothetical protein